MCLPHGSWSDGGTADGTPRTEKADVRGESWPVHKISTGDWAEWRIQHTAEETWAENAKRIARAVTAAARKVRAAFVVLGGDVRERSMVLEELPVALQQNTVIVDREVQPDAAAFEDAARAEVARRADLESDASLEEFARRISVTEPGSRRAVEGLDETLTALRDGLASDVLLGGEPVCELTAWIGPGMAEAAAGEEQLVAFGVTDPVPDRADAALARSVAGTGASLHLLRSDPGAGWPRDGVGALLRAPIAVL